MDKPSTTCLITINKIGIIQSVDNNCFAMFGYSLSELIGQPVTIFIPSPYKEQHDSYLENYHTTGKARIIGRSRTVEGQHKDGTIFTMRLAVSEINIGPSSLYIGLITKIEDTTAIVTIDKYGIIVSCNKNCENLWGYSEDFLIGKNVKLLMPNPHQELHDTYLNNYHETGKMKVIGYIRNVPALHKSGIVFPVCLQVQRIRIDDVEFFRAKVERVEEEREVLFTLDQNGTILSCNRNILLPLMGFTADELKGKPISVILKSLREKRKRKFNSEDLLENKVKKFDDSTLHDMKQKSSNENKIEKNIENTNTENHTNTTTETNGEEIKKSNHNENLGDLGNHANPSLSNPTVPAVSSQFTARSADQIGASLTSVLEEWIQNSPRITECEHKDKSCFTVSVSLSKFTSEHTILYSCKIRRLSDNSIERMRGRFSTFKKPFDDSSSESILICDGKYSISETSIGSGSYGKVRLGTNVNTNQLVAIKILQKDIMDQDELVRARREIDILKCLRHPNICCLYDSYETHNRIYLVMEYISGGELFTYINERGKISEAEAQFFFKQILSAVEFCHSNNIIHRDIKHKNILLDKNCIIKLIDFGLSNFTKEGELRGTFCGTPAYSAPEMIIGRKYVGPEVDVWSLGVVLYTMLTGEFPFQTMSDITNGTYPPPKNVSTHCSDIIAMMLTVDTNKRASIIDLQRHSFITNGEVKEVLPDLSSNQVPEYQQIPLELVLQVKTKPLGESSQEYDPSNDPNQTSQMENE